MTQSLQIEMRSRGIGSDWIPCFICGAGGLKSNIAAFVRAKSDGDRIVALFTAYDFRATLDWREQEPEWIQIKIGGCKEHFASLEKLNTFIKEKSCITPSILDEFITP